MKLTVVALCAVLCVVDVVIAQESDWLSGTWKGIRKLEFASTPTYLQKRMMNSPGAETVLHLQYNAETKAITGNGEAQILRIANSNFSETVLEGSFFNGNKVVLILKQIGGPTDGAVRKYVMERQPDGSLSGYSDSNSRSLPCSLCPRSH